MFVLKRTNYIHYKTYNIYNSKNKINGGLNGKNF